MPSLNWIGREAVERHHTTVPFHLLRADAKRSIGDPDSGNMLVQADNLVALRALLPYYAGRMKCVYIDPPYNTGDESWIYNDNVNSPEMREWLGRVVGREGEDLSRHDKWLCMMFPRLLLLRQFLRNDGVVFVSIDENEAGYLRPLMDEIFGRMNDLGTLVWKRRSSSAMRGTPLSIDHEYILAYARDVKRATLYGLEKGVESYPHEDGRGHYASTDLTVGMGKDARPGQFYAITNPRTGKVYQPNPERVWRFFPETMSTVIEDDLIIWPDEVGGKMERPRYKTYYNPNSEKPKPVSSWIETANTNDREIDESEADYDVSILTSGMNQEGGRLLQQILGSKAFAYPKPVSLIRSLIRATTRDNDIVMDSFAGSGTTAQAVMELNQEDEGGRRFIMVELESEIAQNVTAERLLRVVQGYTWIDTKGKKHQVSGLGGGFQYCTLGPTLLDSEGRIRPEVTFGELARFVYLQETGTALPRRTNGKIPLLGVHHDTAVYLLYNGILQDKTPGNGNSLTRQVLAGLPPHSGPKVIYGTRCLLGEERLRREGIAFRHIPTALRTD